MKRKTHTDYMRGLDEASERARMKLKLQADYRAAIEANDGAKAAVTISELQHPSLKGES